MPYNLIQAEKLLLEGTSSNQVYLHISDTSKSNERGVIFGFIETPRGEDNHETFAKIFRILEYYYYHVCDDPQYTVAEAFEQALKNTNTEILRLIQKEELALDLKEFNIMAVLLYPSPSNYDKFEMHLSYHHNAIKAMLIHKFDSSRYRLMDILKSNEPNGEPNFLSIFPQMISGELSSKDSLFVCNDTVMDYLSTDEIREIISKLPPKEASLQFSQLLSNFPVNFGGILIKLVSHPYFVAGGQKMQTSETPKQIGQEIPANESFDSLKNLLLTKDKTYQVLSPIKIRFQKILSWLKENAGIFQDMLHKILSLLKDIPSQVINFVGNILFKNFLGGIYRQFKSLSMRSKFLLILSLFITAGVVYSVILVSQNQQQKQLTKQYQTTAADIKTKLDTALSTIIYDESKTRLLIKDVEKLLSEIPPSIAIQQNQFIRETQNTLQNIKYQIQKMIVPEMALITDLTAYHPQIALFEIELLGDKLYIASQTPNSVYISDLKNNSNLEVPFIKKTQTLIALKADAKNLITVDSENQIHSLSSGEVAFSQKPILTPHTAMSVSDLLAYNGKIYILDAAASQIYRYILKDGLWSYEKNWLTEPTDISQAISMTIDGSIYLLQDNNTILTLRLGKRHDQQIALTSIEPPLAKSSRIFTHSDTAYLYLLDPGSKRFIVLDKNTGQLKNQYTHDEWTDLKDFAVIEDKEVYLLNGKQVIKIKL